MKEGLKKAVLIVGVLISVAALVVSLWLGLSNESKSSERVIVPNLTSVRAADGGATSFIPHEMIVDALPFNFSDTVPQTIDTYSLEQHLAQQSPLIKEVNAYITPHNKSLHILVTERTPILRYYTFGASYIVDIEGVVVQNKYPIGILVPIATGAVTPEVVQETLYPLALYLRGHKEWEDFFSAIEVISPSRIHLYPRVGDYVFEIADAANLERDLAKIPIFYKEIVPRVGSNKYRLVKLSYRNQIVCVLRNGQKK